MSTPHPPTGWFQHVVAESKRLLQSDIVLAAPRGGATGMYAVLLRLCVALSDHKEGVPPSERDGGFDSGNWSYQNMEEKQLFLYNASVNPSLGETTFFLNH